MMFTENPFAGLNKHELSKKKICHDAETQTEDVRFDRDHPLFASLLQGLEEIVHYQSGLTAQSWDNRPALELHEHEADSSDHSSSESVVFEDMGEH